MPSSLPNQDFMIITALRYDPLLLTSEENSQPTLNFISPSPFYMLRYHRDRLLEAAQHFEFENVVEKLQDGKALHETLLQQIENLKERGGQDEALKVRVLFDKNGKMTVEISVVPPVSLATLFPSSFDPPNASMQPHPAKVEQKPFKPSPLTGGALSLGPTDSLSSHSQSTPASAEWHLRLDKEPTPSSPFTLLKTTVREIYNNSRARALPTNPNNPTKVEVLMYNECSELTEGSTTSLYLFRGGYWVTPPVGVPAGDLTSLTLKNGDKVELKMEESERWDESELRKPFAGRWGHSVRSAKVGAGGQRGTTRRWALSKSLCMEETVSIDTVRVGEGLWVSNAVKGFGFGKIIE